MQKPEKPKKVVQRLIKQGVPPEVARSKVQAAKARYRPRGQKKPDSPPR